MSARSHKCSKRLKTKHGTFAGILVLLFRFTKFPTQSFAVNDPHTEQNLRYIKLFKALYCMHLPARY